MYAITVGKIPKNIITLHPVIDMFDTSLNSDMLINGIKPKDPNKKA